jgi:hypothetical protein
MERGFERLNPQQVFDQTGGMLVARRLWTQGKNGNLLVEMRENRISFF